MSDRTDHSGPRRRRWARPLLATVGLAIAGLSLLPAAPAAAHVRAAADNPTSGGFSAVTFRVPNESDSAGTVKLSVSLPTDTPFVYVSTKPRPRLDGERAQGEAAQAVRPGRHHDHRGGPDGHLDG